MKRLFDIVVVVPALVVLAPLLVMIALAVRLTSRGPVLFKQERMGRNMRPFPIYKFRTMVPNAEGLGPGVTPEGDARVTGLGRFLRASKLDELPQLFNVLKGDMSLVGPRPELPKYVALFEDEFREILKVRPGITDPASIAYRSESSLLEGGGDPERVYLDVILPRKIRLSKAYVERASLRRDFLVILQTLVSLASGRAASGAEPAGGRPDGPRGSGGARRVLLIGSAQAAEGVLRELAAGRLAGYEVVGLVDPGRAAGGGWIGDVPVHGMQGGLAAVVTQARPEELWIVGRAGTEEPASDIVHQSVAMGLPLKALPNMRDLVESKELARRLRRFEPEDLLFREPIPTDLSSLKAFYAGKRILITGAGGSIGAELCRQLAACAPEELSLLEKHEASLYAIDHELRDSHPNAHVEPYIGDVADESRVNEIMKRARPSIVVHAAAYKHVPMMERNPSEAFKTNACGTKVVARAASRAGAEIFLLISTDKAVEPTSVMGLSKRLAELTIQRAPSSGPTKYMAVRFGNVLASSGSVVPLFMDQIARGGPVTVTDPEITRHFMTIREAVHLVLQAGTMGSGGEVFVLDMGEPVRIVDLARALIRLYGYTPERDVPIVFTGLRPGERQVEKLFNEHEEILKTSHPKILMAVDHGSHGGADLMKLVETVHGKIPPAEVAELRTALAEVLG